MDDNDFIFFNGIGGIGWYYSDPRDSLRIAGPFDSKDLAEESYKNFLNDIEDFEKSGEDGFIHP